MSSNPEDLTPQARIRATAVELFGRRGFARTTVRHIASGAGVSPGLVIHHFGSKDGLRSACDDWVMDTLQSEKAFIATGGNLPALRDYAKDHPELERLMDYVVAALREGGETASRIFDRLCAFTEDMMQSAAASGLARVPQDPEATYATLVAYSCGAMLMEPQLAATLGGTRLDEPPVLDRYGSASVDLFVHGIFDPAYGEALMSSLHSSPQDGTHA